jgi:predicted nucleotidyltransferase component of viral defense system
MRPSEQLNARLRALSKEIGVSPQILLRFYLMERLLERIALSKYKRHFILKGGMLVASMVGISTRATMDIDAMMNGITVSAESIGQIFGEIVALESESGITFAVTDIREIREDAEYTGFRITINAAFDKIRQSFNVDISVGDTIVPDAVEYGYSLLLEDRNISVFAYHVETVLAEKLETILARSVANTRMRDFYDVYILQKIFGGKIETEQLRLALSAVSDNRGSTEIVENYQSTVAAIKASSVLADLWERYTAKNEYAKNVKWQVTIETIEGTLSSLV